MSMRSYLYIAFYVTHRGNKVTRSVDGSMVTFMSLSLITTQDNADLSGCWPRQIFGYSSLLFTTDTFVSLLRLHKEGGGLGHPTD